MATTERGEPSESSTCVTIDAMRPDDWPAVSAIYAEGIATGNATFETRVPDWDQWNATRLPDCRFVARDESGRVLGWAALNRVSRKSFLAGVAEVSVYVAEAVRGRGIGRRLLEQLIAASEEAGTWTLQAAVFPENESTIRLHRNAGFRIVGRRERIGMHEGRWRDTLLLERRSDRAALTGD
jgi:phosphinothricin acetyltransferase